MVIDNNFIKEHDRLVRVIVNQYHVSGVDPEDLMQEGRIGLIEAVLPPLHVGLLHPHPLVPRTHSVPYSKSDLPTKVDRFFFQQPTFRWRSGLTAQRSYSPLGTVL